MKILFLGNSLLGSVYSQYIEDPTVLMGADCSFAIDIGGWGPAFTICNDKLIPSDRTDKKEYPDFFYPESMPNESVKNFDVIVVFAIGSIGCGLGESADVCNSGVIFEFEPRETEVDKPPISKVECNKMLSVFLNSQGGIKLLDYLKDYNSKKIIFEMPYLSEEITRRPDWILSKMYQNPIAAYRYFTNYRHDFLYEKTMQLGFEFVPAMFGNLGFTPAKYVDSPDLFHTNNEYAKLILSSISDLIRSENN